jgi:hypothetical protein
MTYKYKAQTESTPLLSLDGNTEALARQSSQSPKTDNTQTSTQTTKAQSENTLKSDNSDKTIAHAMILRAALLSLEKTGLVKRLKVLSKTEKGNAVIEIRVVFDPAVWTEDLKLLSTLKNK